MRKPQVLSRAARPVKVARPARPARPARVKQVKVGTLTSFLYSLVYLSTGEPHKCLVIIIIDLAGSSARLILQCNAMQSGRA